jgi:hypothetical protein
MSASLRSLSLLAVLVAGMAVPMPAGLAAELLPRAASAVHARERHWYRHHWASSGLVAGVRGATPLTVPFFGYNWYPGPVHYYGPPPGWFCCEREEAAISVRY